MDNDQDDIFYITARYVAELREGKHPHISDYIARYPQYADALADFVAYYQAFEADGLDGLDNSAPVPLSPLSQAALARALHRVQAEPPAPITSLLATSTRYFTLAEFARKLDLSADIVALLEQRVIDPSTLPHELYRRIAHVLQQPVSAVQTYLASSSNPAGPEKGGWHSMKVAEEPARYHMPHDSYSSDHSFRSLIKESLWLSPSQRSTWEAILDQEGL